MGETTTTTTTTTNDEISVSGNMDLEVDGGGVGVDGEVTLGGAGAIIDIIEAVGDVVKDIVGAMGQSLSSDSSQNMETENLVATVDDNELVFKFKKPGISIEMAIKKKLVIMLRKQKLVLVPGKYKSKKSQLRLATA